MLFIKRLSSFIVFFLLLMTPELLFSKNFIMKYDGQCGGVSFLIEIIQNINTGESQFICLYKIEGSKKRIFYKPALNSYLHVACIQDNKKDDLLLINESYGGNVGPEDIYGIFDPKTKKMLLKPSDWPKGNSKQVEQVIGYYPSFSVFEKQFFCCENWRERYVDQ